MAYLMLIVGKDSFQIQNPLNYVGIHSSLCTILPFMDTFYDEDLVSGGVYNESFRSKRGRRSIQDMTPSLDTKFLRCHLVS